MVRIVRLWECKRALLQAGTAPACHGWTVEALTTSTKHIIVAVHKSPRSRWQRPRGPPSAHQCSRLLAILGTPCRSLTNGLPCHCPATNVLYFSIMTSELPSQVDIGSQVAYGRGETVCRPLGIAVKFRSVAVDRTTRPVSTLAHARCWICVVDVLEFRMRMSHHRPDVADLRVSNKCAANTLMTSAHCPHAPSPTLRPGSCAHGPPNNTLMQMARSRTTPHILRA